MTSGKVATTLGYERRNNPALRFQDLDAFVRFMNDGQPARPANVKNIVAINRGTLPLTMDLPKAPALDVRAFAELAAQGHIVIDTRSSAAFGAGHVPHAYHIHLSSLERGQARRPASCRCTVIPACRTWPVGCRRGRLPSCRWWA